MDTLREKFQENYGFLKSDCITDRSQWRALNKMLNNNSVSRVKRGLYRLNNFTHESSFVEVSHIVPGGILCMISAWSYYNLTTTIPHENHVAVTQNKKVRLPNYPPIKLYYLSEGFYQLGITQIVVDGMPVKIYDLEKSVCDAIRFRNKLGLDITFEVVKNYVGRKDRDFNKLTNYARLLRIDKIAQDIIMPMI
jgi:predicted transcriptional regulator of viral defense system